MGRFVTKVNMCHVGPGVRCAVRVKHTPDFEDFANVFAKENDIDVVLKGFKSDYDHEGRDHPSHVRVGHRASI